MSTNTETGGRKHTNWLNMMYPRLKLARNLLTNDGVMFISIDENEVTNLYKVCKEILGEKNIIGPLPVVMNLKGNQDAYGFAETHEFVMVCFKNKDLTTLGYLPIEDEELSAEWKEDSYGFFKEADNLRATGVNAPREKRPNLWYPIFLNETTKLFYVSDINKPIDENDKVIYPVNPEGEELSWYWSKATFNNNKHNLILKHTSNGWQFYRKQRPKLGDLPTKKPKSFLFKPEYSTSTATTKLKDLMTRKIFDGPKPVPFLIDLMRLATNKESIILDFFSGSATTAHAAMKLNAEEGGSRKFIMVQLPEETDDKSEAYKAGYKTISEIGQERIRRAGENIIGESSEAAEHLDIGFKVLKLDKSNIREWNVDFENLEGQITSYDNMFVSGRSELDLVYEIMLKYGLELTYPINSFQVEDKNVYDIAMGNLFICLDENIDTTIAQAIIDKRNEYEIETSSVVFADHGFHGNDSEKLNCFKLLEDAGYQNEQLMTI